MTRTRTNRFGEAVQPGATLGSGYGWKTRRCTGPCGQQVGVFEIPAGYRDDEDTWGPYVCGDCQDTAVLCGNDSQQEGVI